MQVETAPALDCATSVLHKDRPKVVNAGIGERRQIDFYFGLRQVNHLLFLGAPLTLVAQYAAVQHLSDQTIALERDEVSSYK